VKTTMTQPHLPPNVTDYIIDLICDDPKTLQACCLVSKSWIPRSRAHIFNSVEFETSIQQEAWKKTFPIPQLSPAHLVRSLKLSSLSACYSSSAEGDDWIQPFTNVVRLELDSILIPSIPSCLHLSVKSLIVPCNFFLFPRTLDLIRSFPHLEDLDISKKPAYSGYFDRGVHFRPSVETPSPFTGTLVIAAKPESVASSLLSLQDGLRFREIVWMPYPRDKIEWAMALVERCSDTLEYFKIGHPVLGKLCSFGGVQYFNIDVDFPLLQIPHQRLQSTCQKPQNSRKSHSGSANYLWHGSKRLSKQSHLNTGISGTSQSTSIHLLESSRLSGRSYISNG
jgi:hypothetical protein